MCIMIITISKTVIFSQGVRRNDTQFIYKIKKITINLKFTQITRIKMTKYVKMGTKNLLI